MDRELRKAASDKDMLLAIKDYVTDLAVTPKNSDESLQDYGARVLAHTEVKKAVKAKFDDIQRLHSAVIE